MRSSSFVLLSLLCCYLMLYVCVNGDDTISNSNSNNNNNANDINHDNNNDGNNNKNANDINHEKKHPEDQTTQKADDPIQEFQQTHDHISLPPRKVSPEPSPTIPPTSSGTKSAESSSSSSTSSTKQDVNFKLDEDDDETMDLDSELEKMIKAVGLEERGDEETIKLEKQLADELTQLAMDMGTFGDKETQAAINQLKNELHVESKREQTKLKKKFQKLKKTSDEFLEETKHPFEQMMDDELQFGRANNNNNDAAVGAALTELDRQFNNTVITSFLSFANDSTPEEIEEKKREIAISLMQLTKAGSNEAAQALAWRYRYGIGVTKSCPQSYNLYITVAETLMRQLEALMDGRDIPLDMESMRLSSWELDGVLGEEDDDIEQVLEFSQIAAESGDVLAQKEIGWRSLLGRGLDRNHEQAMAQFENAAGAGDPEAMYNLGFMHLQGLHVSKNVSKAAEYFQQAAKGNITQAHNALGYIYFRGEEIGRNLTMAQHHFEIAASDGDADANYNLGLLIEERRTNSTEAARRFSIAAASGHWRGMLAWAEVQFHGIGIKQTCDGAVKTLSVLLDKHGKVAESLRSAIKDFKKEKYDEALWTFQVLSEQGVEVAQSNAAYMLRKGLGRPRGSIATTMTVVNNDNNNHINNKDDEGGLGRDSAAKDRVVFNYHQMSADQGSIDDIYRLGACYWDGIGVKENKTRAVELFEVAAANRSASAAIALGYMHHWGIGVPQNFTLAEEYYQMSSKHHVLHSPVSQLPSLIAIWVVRLHAALDEFLRIFALEWILNDPTIFFSAIASIVAVVFVTVITLELTLPG